MLNAIIVGVSVVLLMLAAEWVSSSSLRLVDYVFAGIYGLLAGMIVSMSPFFVGTAYILAPFALIVTVLMTCYLVYWWSSPRALLPLAAVMAIIFFVAKSAAVMTAAPIGSGFLKSLLLIVPEMVLIGTIGTMLVNLLWVYQNGKFKILAISLGVVAGIIALLILIFRVNWADLPRGPVATETETETEDSGATGNTTGNVWIINTRYGSIPFTGAVMFYNSLLQYDNDPKNDFNFGVTPGTGLTAEEYDYILRQRMAQDPALTAGVLAWFDANLGTRFLGTFYESCKEDWALTINEAKDKFAKDVEVWFTKLVEINKVLDAHASVFAREEGDLKDQMWMNPYSGTGCPDLIVMSTDQGVSLFLVYEVEVKGNIIKVSFRIECGYQPTNVQEVMHIVPDDSPRDTYTPETNPPRREEQPETNPPRREEQPETNPQPETSAPKKDPSKTPKVNTKPNDDPGPGSSTNNGVGATTSTADQPTNSNHYPSVEDYQKEVEELGTINQEQKTGDDPSIPSTSPTATDSGANVDNNVNETPSVQPVTVDNNGDAGNGGAAINTPTPPPSADTVDGDPESVGMIGAPD